MLKEIKVVKIAYDFTTEKPYRAYAVLPSGQEILLFRFDPEDEYPPDGYARISLLDGGEDFTSEPECYAFSAKLTDK